MQRLKSVPSGIAGVAVFAVLILLYNVQFAAFVGDPRIPTLQDKWWGGYYLSTSQDTVWCLVRFSEQDRRVRMTVLTESGRSAVFKVIRNSSDETFIHLSMSSSDGTTTVAAKQLYEGQRYFIGRLMARRWSNFWKKNEDISVRGEMLAAGSTVPFEIEPIPESRVPEFYRSSVSPGSTSTLEDLSSQVTAALAPRL